MIFRHVVQMTFKREPSADELARFRQVHDDLGAQAPTVKAFSHGPDAGVRPGGASWALVGDFDSPEAWQEYSKHPAHDVVREALKELDLVGGVSVVQYWTEK
ncbi:Dabb family protein [Streptomyces sp. NPDC050625]|uniref:Dabb family protein n=1 Tax=Streptomyces sp. NPDC050625 TaxID=3154629 RepID=UPI00342EF32B